MPAWAPVSETAFLPSAVDRHRGEGDRGLLARRKQYIHLALGRLRRDFARHLDEIIRHARHRGNDRDDLVSLLLRGDDALGDIENSLRGSDGSAAVFLDNEAHSKERLIVEG